VAEFFSDQLLFSNSGKEAKGTQSTDRNRGRSPGATDLIHFDPHPDSPYAMGPLSCLSVMLVYCGLTVGWIKMPLGMEVVLGPGDIVLDGDPAAPHREGCSSSPHFSAHVY